MLCDPQKFRPYVAPSESPLVESLKRARAMVAEKWCHGLGSDDQGAVCALVAMSRGMAVTHEELLLGHVSSAHDLIYRAIGSDDLIGWNDAPGRTQAEVVAAFDRAIELARAENGEAK